MRVSLTLAVSVSLLAGGVGAQDQRTDHDAAIAAIRRLGGEVKVDKERAGAPVSIVLAGASSPAECLPHLTRITNLHTCDL
jgi:hypothetical protein